jgi:bisphosphoglycerate-independent phosphoglycerate mutase (AlkP superfamily)
MSVDIFAEELMLGGSLDFNNINKSALAKVSGAVVDRVMSGDEDPLEAYIKAKAVQEVASKIIDDLKGSAIDEAEKYLEPDAKMLGCSFVVKQGATSYSFDHDEEWKRVNEEIEALKKILKEREKKMIDAMSYAEIVDDKTGEVIPPATIKKHSSSILAVTIPKE